jgi:hypothetical protein
VSAVIEPFLLRAGIEDHHIIDLAGAGFPVVVGVGGLGGVIFKMKQNKHIFINKHN